MKMEQTITRIRDRGDSVSKLSVLDLDAIKALNKKDDAEPKSKVDFKL